MLKLKCRTITATLLLSYLFLCSLLYAADELRESEVVVEVNDVAITQGELDMAIEKLLPRLFYHRNISSEKRKEIEKKAIEELINEELFFQEAKAQGFKAEKSEVKERFNNIEKQYPSKKAFKEEFKKYGVSREDIEEKIKKDILIEKLIDKEVKVILTDKEVEGYYNKNTEKFHEPESVSVRYILIRFNMTEPDFRKKARAKAEEVLSKLKTGEDFAKVASSYSDDMSRIKGGEVGFIHKGRFAPEIEKVAFSLKVGQISNLIENEYGYHIIKVEDKKPSRQIPFSEIKEKLKEELTTTYQAKKKEELINRLRYNAKIKYY